MQTPEIKRFSVGYVVLSKSSIVNLKYEVLRPWTIPIKMTENDM